MRDLVIFFKIVFQSARISYSNLKKFAEITIQRISMNNPGGIYTGILTALTNAYTAFFGDITDEETKMAIKEGSTITMNNAWKAFVLWVREKEGIVRGTFGIGSAIYEEFFPHGLTEYTRMTLGNAETLMNRFINVTTIHQAQLPPAFLTDVTALRDSFVDARTLQNQLVSEVEGERLEKYGTREAIEIALMKCVLFIAYNNVGNTDVVDVYFDQSFLKPSKPKVFADNLLKGATVNLYEHEFGAGDEIKAENNGDTPWMLCLALTADTVCGSGVTVAVGETVILTADNFGDVTVNRFLNITNLDADHDGSYKITV